MGMTAKERWTTAKIIFLQTAVGGGIIMYALYTAQSYKPVAKLEMDHETCVTQCVTILRDKQVFPEFQRMVDECSRNYGAGCYLVSEKLNERK